MARVLIQTLVFPPDGVSTADILGSLAHELKDLGHDITVITTTPHYNVDASARAAQPLRRRAFSAWLRSDFHGIDVYHIPARAGRHNAVVRALDNLLFHVLGAVLAVRLRRQFDVVLVVSPPPTAGFVAALTAAVLRVPYIYNVQEVFPDALVHLGVMRPNGIGARVLGWAERVAYRRAAAVVAVSEDFAGRLRARGAGERLRHIPNFADTGRIMPLPRRGSGFAREYGLDDEFVITYAGNLGMSQDWTALADAAADLSDVPGLRFVLVGGGVEAERLRALCEARALANVMMLPYQPAERVADIYASSDLCLVPMRPHLDFDTLPSKCYSIMAAARPVLVYADPQCALARLVADVGCGLVVPRGNGRALAAAIRAARADREALARMGERGREHVMRTYTPVLIARQYDALLAAVTAQVPQQAG